MQLLYAIQDEKIDPIFVSVMSILLVAFIFIVVFRQVFGFVETFWVEHISPKPFYNHIYFIKQKLTDDQLYILESQFSFYQKLDKKKKRYFEHRVAKFIKSHSFKGRKGVYIDDQKKVLISATAIMLTFGYRDFIFKSLDKFLIYPKVFYSKLNNADHKGEFNPGYKAIVFSWEDFMQGYDIDNDNFNLGIHEIVHAMHFDYLRKSNTTITASIFINHYDKLKRFLNENPWYRDNLVKSKYLRSYAFNNNFEFIAVLIESFMETPLELRTQFPEIYDHVKKMLNFERVYL